jgi:hypothetical protein
MIGEQYFIDVMSKVEKFIQFQNFYKDFNSSGILPDYILYAIFGLMGVAVIPAILTEKKMFTKIERFVISIIIFILSFWSGITFFEKIKLHYEMDESVCKIELRELKPYAPINFQQFPEWATESLRDDGYIKCYRVYKVFQDREKEIEKKKKEKEIKARTQEMKEMGNMGD